MTATGFLSMPKIPDIDGIEGFRGRILHTSAWDDVAFPRPVRALFARAPGTQRALRRAGARLLEALMVAGVVRFQDHPRAPTASARPSACGTCGARWRTRCSAPS